MSFQGILVDRARRVHRLVGHRNAELGESEQVVQYGDWYKVRISVPESTEEHPVNEAVENRLKAELLMPKDFALDINDRIEVESKELEISGIWLLEGQPAWIRKKRSVLGKRANVVKVTTI